MSIKLDFSGCKVLIAGDLMLDRYWLGEVNRISPEAPVPVVHVRHTHSTPGGAGNVAANVTGLGAKAILLSVVGDDYEGLELEELLKSKDVETKLLHDTSVPTTVKLRVIARNQQIVRVDFEERIDHELLLPLVDQFCASVCEAGAVILSDYGKGGLVHVQRMMKCAIDSGIPIFIDPKGTNYSLYRGATTITPNKNEFEIVAGSWSNESDFEMRAFSLRDTLELGSLLVTRSDEGMSLFLGTQHIRIPTLAREVFDVSGAGDTVISTMATATAAGHDIQAAARLANVAAGIVVGKAGTTPITLEELQSNV